MTKTFNQASLRLVSFMGDTTLAALLSLTTAYAIFKL
jgi:hypothetical protein